MPFVGKFPDYHDTGKTVPWSFGRRIYRLDGPVLYQLPIECQSGDSIVYVTRGIATDFASVPWFFWWLVRPTGQHQWAAVIHDHLYADERNSRRLADAIFWEAMRELGVPYWRRLIIWAAVRIGGGFARRRPTL